MMLWIGSYGIAFGYTWMQTGMVQVRHFRCFWLFKKASPDDIDKRKRFPLGTVMNYKGRRYYYYKMGK